MKQLIPTSIDEYIAEQKVGDTVSGRVVEIAGAQARVELGEGIRATCKIKASAAVAEDKSAAPASGKADLSSLTTMLQARWKGNAPAAESQTEPLTEGQIRSFKITKLDVEAKKIEVELA
jgi:small subunit ribosomal protein S1